MAFYLYRKKQDCCLPYISPVQSTARSPQSLQPFHVEEGKPSVDQKLRLKCTTFPFCKDRQLTPRTLDLKEGEFFFPTSNSEDHPGEEAGGGLPIVEGLGAKGISKGREIMNLSI